MMCSVGMTNSSARTGVLALLLAVAAQAAAQAPSHALALSPSAVHAFAHENAIHLQILDVVGGKRRAGKLTATQARPEGWTLFGRVGRLRFTNQIDSSDGTHFSLRGSSHGLQGNLYIGIHRRF